MEDGTEPQLGPPGSRRDTGPIQGSTSHEVDRREAALTQPTSKRRRPAVVPVHYAWVLWMAILGQRSNDLGLIDHANGPRVDVDCPQSTA